MKLVAIKALCRRAHVEKVDAGPKGVVDRLPRQRLRQSAGPGALRREQGADAKVRPDMRVVFMRDFASAEAAGGHADDPADARRHCGEEGGLKVCGQDGSATS